MPDPDLPFAPPAPMTPATLGVVLATLRRDVPDDLYRPVADAIEASPLLAEQMETLVQHGLLTRIAILPRAAGDGSPFDAKRAGAWWVMTPAFVRSQAPRRLYDVVHDDDILPDNMVFALAHLAWHAARAADLDARLRALDADEDPSLDAAARRERIAAAHVREQAGACIQAWNDVLDAAHRKNRGEPLSAQQFGSVLMNLRYRAPFVLGGDTLRYEAGWRIVLDDANLDTLVGILMRLESMFDVE